MVLKAVEGQLLNNVFIVGEQGATLGRHSASNDIVISESFVSRRHCEITFESTKFFLKDVGSTTGTFLMTRNSVQLKENMMFQMGLSEFKVVFPLKGPELELHVFEGPSRNKIIPVERTGLGIGRDP